MNGDTREKGIQVGPLGQGRQHSPCSDFPPLRSSNEVTKSPPQDSSAAYSIPIIILRVGDYRRGGDRVWEQILSCILRVPW